MATVEVSDEVRERLEEIVAHSKKHYPGYGHLHNTADELAEAYLAAAIRNRDELKRVGELPFVPLHGR